MKLSAVAAGDSARESLWWPSAVWAVWARRHKDEEALWELCCRAAPTSGLKMPLRSGDADTALGPALQPGEGPAVCLSFRRGNRQDRLTLLSLVPTLGWIHPHESPRPKVMLTSGYSVLQREAASPRTSKQLISNSPSQWECFLIGFLMKQPALALGIGVFARSISAWSLLC